MFLTNNKRKINFIVIGLCLVVSLITVLFFLRNSFVINSIDKELSDYNDVPDITVNNGKLRYNSVSVNVPKEGASYTIGYDWGKHDTDYPSIPSTASAYYTNEDEQILYEILLYRDLVAPKIENGNKVSLDTWFDNWKPESGKNATQEPYTTRNTKGILVRVSDDNYGNKGKKYCSYNYYFAVDAGSNIEQYVLEVNYYDSDSIDNAEDLFKACADSITIKK